VLEKNVYENLSDPMEGVVAEVRVIMPCKRFAIKDNGICDRSLRAFYGEAQSLIAFFA